jgi:hypothetical protein
MQDRVGQAEVDIPAREMYADMLLADNRPAESLVQYRIALKLSPIGSTHSTTQAVPQKLRENLRRRSASISNY